MKVSDGFGRGLLQGQGFAMNMLKAYEMGQSMQEDGERKQALSEIASAKPAESTGFTADQGRQLEGLAKQGYAIDFNTGKSAYVARNAAGDTKTVAMQGVTDYMGERSAGTLSREQQDSTRMLAMADVIGKTDPARGIQMRQQVQQGNHAAKRQAREEKTWAREDDVERIDGELGAKFKQSLVGPDGQPRAATADDYLANQQERAFALQQAGHSKAADAAIKEHMALSHVKIQMDAAGRKEAAGKAAAAIAAGDYSVAAEFYNRYVPSGAKVTSIEAGKNGQIVMNRTGLDGRPMEPMTVKNQGEALAMLRALDDPMALYQYSQGEFQNQLRLRGEARADNADRRADRADGRSAAAHGLAMADRGERLADKREARDVREALAKETSPDMTPTQLRAVRAGIIQTPGADNAKAKFHYDPVKVQKAFGETSTEVGGKETVKRNQAEEKKFQEFMADNPNIRDVDEGLVKYNRAKVQGERQETRAKNERHASVREAMTPERLEATAKKYNMTVDEVIEQLNKQGISR